MRFFLASFCLLFMTQSFAAQFVLCEADQNILAKNVYGYWEYDAALSELIGDKANTLERMRITPDSSVLSYFAPIHDELIEDTCVYASGFMDIFSSNEQILLARPFILVSHNGIPYIYWLKAYGPEGFNGRAFQATIAAGSDSSLDRLILGDDAKDEGEAMKFLKRIFMAQ